MNDRVALVTGGSSGIGRATAVLLSEHGWRTYGTSRAAAPRSDADPRVAPVVMDVTNDASVAGAIGSVIDADGRLDLVVNSAGYGLAGSIEDTSVEEAQAQFDTNFFGTIRVTKAVLPHMRRQRRGLIVNVGSIGGLIGLPFQALYSASKFALEGLTEGLRQEVAPYGIGVVVVEPGDVCTNITANRVVARAAGNGSVYDSAFQAALRIIEHEEQSGVGPEVVARVILRLASSTAPPVRVRVGKFAQTSTVLVKHALGSRTFERLLMTHYGLR
jgi:NAD(P)-dependent dehydrogenase (short-subunit alcohol dehydrogenase family)